jgi:hypothetical protein
MTGETHIHFLPAHSVLLPVAVTDIINGIETSWLLMPSAPLTTLFFLLNNGTFPTATVIWD